MLKSSHLQNLFEAYLAMAKVPGWDALDLDRLLVLAAPVAEPFASLAWGEATPAAILRARDCCAGRPFSWALNEGQAVEPLRQAGFHPAGTSTEMVLDLEEYGFPGLEPGITVIRAYSDQDFHTWSDTAAEALGLPPGPLRAFMRPLVRVAGCIPFLALFQGTPAATSLAFHGLESTGLYTVATREAFRRRGLGCAVTHACLRAAQNHGSRRAVLSASAMGLPMYRKLGFRVEGTCRNYVWRPVPSAADPGLFEGGVS